MGLRVHANMEWPCSKQKLVVFGVENIPMFHDVDEKRCKTVTETSVKDSVTSPNHHSSIAVLDSKYEKIMFNAPKDLKFP